MGYEDLEDVLNDTDYLNALDTITLVEGVATKVNQFEYASSLKNSWIRISKDYIDFRLDKFDSEGRMVIREVYGVLGYNPNIKR